MSTMTKILSRVVLLRKSSPSPPRYLSTAVTGAPVSSEKRDYNEWSSLILGESNNQEKGMTKSEFVSLCNYFRSQKNYRAAVQLYDWLETTNKLELISNGGQTIRINLLWNVNGLASAENYFNNLKDSDKTKKTYGALLSCYCKEKVLDKALEIFDQMKELNYLTSYSYNDMIFLYVSIGQPEKVLSLVKEMEERDVHANMYTWNRLIKAYADMGNLDAAEGVLEMMKSKNIKFGSFTYELLAAVCVDSGLHEKAKTFLELMENVENEPNQDVAQGFKTRFKLYSAMNDLSGVIRAWEYLKSNMSSLSDDSYRMMLLALSKLGDKARLEQLYQEWEESCKGNYHKKFDFRIPNVVMEFYLDQNMIRDATDLYEKVGKISTVPNLKALDLFAILSVKKSEIDLALDYLESGLEISVPRKRDWYPPNKTIEIFVKYFEENKDMDRIERFIKIMKKVSQLNCSVYDSFLSNVFSV